MSVLGCTGLIPKLPTAACTDSGRQPTTETGCLGLGLKYYPGDNCTCSAHSSECSMILVVTLVAMMGLARILLNSFVMVRGSTMVTWMGEGVTVVRIVVWNSLYPGITQLQCLYMYVSCKALITVVISYWLDLSFLSRPICQQLCTGSCVEFVSTLFIGQGAPKVLKRALRFTIGKPVSIKLLGFTSMCYMTKPGSHSLLPLQLMNYYWEHFWTQPALGETIGKGSNCLEASGIPCYPCTGYTHLTSCLVSYLTQLQCLTVCSLDGHQGHRHTGRANRQAYVYTAVLPLIRQPILNSPHTKTYRLSMGFIQQQLYTTMQRHLSQEAAELLLCSLAIGTPQHSWQSTSLTLSGLQGLLGPHRRSVPQPGPRLSSALMETVIPTTVIGAATDTSIQGYVQGQLVH